MDASLFQCDNLLESLVRHVFGDFPEILLFFGVCECKPGAYECLISDFLYLSFRITRIFGVDK